MPSITLVPTRATLGFSAGDDGFSAESKTRLAFQVTPERPLLKSIRITTGEEFSNLDGTVLFAPGEAFDERVKLEDILSVGRDAAIIGQLGYLEGHESEFDGPEPASYIAEVRVPESQFDQLVSSARLGTMPAVISLGLAGPGVKIGWEPDGSGTDWDNKVHPRIPIVHVSFHMTFGAGVDEIDDDDTVPRKPALDDLSPTRGQAQELLTKLDAMAAQLNTLPTKIFWIGVALVLALVLAR